MLSDVVSRRGEFTLCDRKREGGGGKCEKRVKRRGREEGGGEVCQKRVESKEEGGGGKRVEEGQTCHLFDLILLKIVRVSPRVMMTRVQKCWRWC
jgi:hypothetical protein